VASGAPPAVCVAAGLAGWGIPVARSMRRVPGLGAGAGGAARTKQDAARLEAAWQAPVADAEAAVARFQDAVDQCRSGPLLDRLVELEEDVLQSLDTCRRLAEAGQDAEAARDELDPAAMRRVAKRLGAVGAAAEADQRAVSDALLQVAEDARARLALINGRLDEAVGRATELLARSVTEEPAEGGGVAAEVAGELGRLSEALHDVDRHDHPHPTEVRTRRGQGRPATG
jgi:hypothetical protein